MGILHGTSITLAVALLQIPAMACGMRADNPSPLPLYSKHQFAPQPFTSGFEQPPTPIVNGAFRASWNQHKWDNNVSNIASGFWYNSPSNLAARVDAAFDGGLESSIFDFSNITSDGLVPNTLFSIAPSVASTPECRIFLDVPSFPLVLPDILTSNQAVYAGTAADPMNGLVTKWQFIFASSIPITVYLNSANVVVGFDYFAANQRTQALTRFFNIILEETDKAAFAVPESCSPAPPSS